MLELGMIERSFRESLEQVFLRWEERQVEGLI